MHGLQPLLPTHTWPPNMERRCRADTTVFTTGSARCVTRDKIISGVT